MSKADALRLGLLLCVLAGPAAAVDCETVAHLDQEFTVCTVDAASADLRLFLRDPETGRPLASFGNVAERLDMAGETLVFAMNAGMYHSDRRPVGHYLEAGETLAPVITSAGPGNFGMLPNGVFCIGDGRADVIETLRFVEEAPACRHATQSGPMLVIDGALHPRFLPDSDSRHVRNGVGSSADGRRVWFAISEAPVTFHDFATLFRDALGAPQALYFDGSISRLYVPALNRHDGGFPMGPIVGVVEPQG
jgi:uncharacterized protein YigE (DUF2233 family)